MTGFRNLETVLLLLELFANIFAVQKVWTPCFKAFLLLALQWKNLRLN